MTQLATQTRPQVLLIEDDRAIRETLSEYLELEGYSVVRAENGAHGLQLLEDQRIAIGLIVLDLMMPVMDGWAFISEIEGRPLRAAVPIMVMSALDDPRIDLDARNIVGHFRKPLDMDRFLRAVETVLG